VNKAIQIFPQGQKCARRLDIHPPGVYNAIVTEGAAGWQNATDSAADAGLGRQDR
jgi:hypothetical protein